MFLNYLSLAITLIGLTLVFYTFIFIHDIPYELAKKRNHPHQESIHVGCWLSLFTLHALWPFLFLWAITMPRPLRVTIVDAEGTESDLKARIAELEAQLHQLEHKKHEGAAHG